MNNLFSKSIIIIAAFALSIGIALGADPSPEATEEVRVTAAKAQLEAESDTISVYVKGLCCPSCGIGVRRNISRLDFIDKSRFNKGVLLDTKTQLATIAVKKGKAAEASALAKAVKDAGYDPVQIYQLSDGKIQTTALPQQAKK